MCGIAGIFDYRGRGDVDRRLLRRMTGLLNHRGPDGDGFYYGPGVGLGHRRLAIIDLAGGDQPLFNEDGTVCVVYNGEIYNFHELMAELSALGHVFRTRCDSEVIVHAWEEWGEACLGRFNGMFAFALYDERRETLFLARDRLGEKPLYYSFLSDGRLLFGSELKAILCAAVDRRLDPQAIEEFFAFGYIPDPRSIYLGVKKLPPAHCLVVRRGRAPPEPRAYWDLDFVDGTEIGSEEASEELIARLRQSVRMRMVADVPLGAFLSGGDDGRAATGADPHLHDLVRDQRLRRISPCCGGCRALSYRSPGQGGRPRWLRPARPSGAGLRRAIRRQLGNADPAGLCDGARERDRRTVRRWRGRSVWRLPALSLALLRGTLAQGLAGTPAQPAVRVPRRGISKARLGAAPAACQGDPGGDGPRHGRGLCRLSLDLVRAIAAPAVQPRIRPRTTGLYRGRGAEATHGPLRQRRPVVASPICRLQDLSAWGHFDQSRPGEHGVFTRGARSVARPYLGRMGRHVAFGLEAAGRRGQAHLQIGARTLSTERDPAPPQAGIYRADRPMVSCSAAPPRARAADWPGSAPVRLVRYRSDRKSS